MGAGANLIYYHDLVRVLVSKELKLRYKNTFLGYVWSVLNPLALATVFFIIFRVFMRIPMENYGLFLVAGLFPWQWFQNSVQASSMFFLGNCTLIKKVRFPRASLVVAGVMNDAVHFLVSIPVILLFMLLHGRHPGAGWLWAVPALLVIQFMLTTGAALIVATCNLFLRDLERLVLIFSLLCFYLTPVLYPVEMIPDGWRWTLYVNPTSSLIVCWRETFLTGSPPLLLLATALGWAAALLALGYRVYGGLEWRFAELV